MVFRNISFILLSFLLIIPNLINCISKFSLKDVQSWFIYLDFEETRDSSSQEELDRFDMAVIDPDHHISFERLKNIPVWVAYVSVGQAENNRLYWQEIKAKSWIIRENPNRKGHYLVDVRHPDWHNVLLDQVIPRLVKDGFHGIMLDNLDTAEFLESEDPDLYEGSKQGLVELIKKIHNRYPDLNLISNNGLSILEDAAPFLSGLIVEDIYWMVDFVNREYKPVAPGDRKDKNAVLRKIMNNHPLAVFNIEYLSPVQEDTITKTIRKSRKLGYRPYVAEKNLSQIYTYTLK